jgi:hypothetical protein
MTIFHAASAEVAVSAETAFAYLSDGLRQGEWTLGSWNREQIGEQLFRGTSLFTGAETFVRITADPEHLLVDYEVGAAPDQLFRVNSARAVPGPAVGRPEGTRVRHVRDGDPHDQRTPRARVLSTAPRTALWENRPRTPATASNGRRVDRCRFGSERTRNSSARRAAITQS